MRRCELPSWGVRPSVDRSASLRIGIATSVDAAWRFVMVSIALKKLRIGCAITLAALVLYPDVSHADESGISFWLPGQEGSLAATRSGFLEDALTSYGDLYPTFKLKWNSGVNNYMFYATGDIPVGDYNPSRLANIGTGHGAIDLGGGYTYLNPATGDEFSGVAGFTYNFKNPDTQYQSGIDFHFDWGVSHFMSKQVFVGFEIGRASCRERV